MQGIDPFLYGGGSSPDYGRYNNLSNQGNRYAEQYAKESKEVESFHSALINSARSNARGKLDKDAAHNISSEILSPDLTRQDVINHIGNDPKRQKLFDAAMEFEAFFLEKMFKEMKKNVPKNELTGGGFAEEVFDDLLTTERVRNISRQSEFGLAEKMYQQLSLL